MNSNRNILVLDDEMSIRESLSDFLEDFDFHVKSAETAEVALEIIKSTPIHIAIVDMRLPGIDGNSFMVLAHEIRPETKFIIHTGSVNYHMSQDVKKVGVKEEFVFLKPIGNLMTFVDAINKLSAKE
ncbi:MAG: response regulator [Deltaproteobacteria bacterium]|nr:response regulator [Deltaproteobacteria bacterium]MBN2674583.1 response regulator [Deltaproteobacteria bacterium]